MKKNKNVIIVEDDEGTSTFLKTTLESEGYSVRTFNEIDYAWSAINEAKAAENYVDVVVLDMYLRKTIDEVVSEEDDQIDQETMLSPDGFIKYQEERRFKELQRILKAGRYDLMQKGEIPEEIEKFFRYLVRSKPPVGVIVMSARTPPAVLFTYLTKGAMGMLIKNTFHGSELVDKVGRCYEKICLKRDYYFKEWSGIRRSPRTAFMSYSSNNSDNALGLVNWLESEGVSVYYAEMSIPAGADWRNELVEAINQAPIFLALLSKEALRSEAVKSELYRAIKRKAREGDEYLLIPLLFHVDIKEIPEELQALNCVNLSDEYYFIERVMELKRIIQGFNKMVFR